MENNNSMWEKVKEYNGRLSFTNIVKECEILKENEALKLWGDINKEAIVIERTSNDFKMVVIYDDGFSVEYPILYDGNTLEWGYNNPYILNAIIKNKMNCISLKKAYYYLVVQLKLGVYDDER